MKTNLLIVSLLFASLVESTAGTNPESERQILGLHLDRPRAEAVKRLQEIGTFSRNERKRQEIWEIRNPSFSHIAIGFDEKDTVRYVTAIAREDKEATRVAYDEVGNLERARQAGDAKIQNLHYEWTLEAEEGHPKTLVSARGRDPKFLSTLSLKRLGNSEDVEDKKE